MSLHLGNKRPLLLLVPAVLLWIVLELTWKAPAPTVVASVDSISAAERRLARLRLAVSTVPGKQEVLKLATAELESREKVIIQAETAAQAQAQLLEIARRTARALPQPVEFTSTELVQQVAPFGQNYGEVFVTLNFTCPIEDVVNLLSELTAQPEAIATRDLRLARGATKKDAPGKPVGVRLTISGLVPRTLVPQKRGAF